MNFEREKKINNLVLHAASVKEAFSAQYLKVPIELCQFALREKKVTEVQIYISGLYLYPGKARVAPDLYSTIAKLCKCANCTVYNKVSWLKKRNWIGKDDNKGWIFFRGLDRVHQIESWEYSRSAIMWERDIRTIKAFFIGAVLSSLVYTGNKGNGTDRKSRRSLPTRYPVSISTLKQILNVSNKTAYNYRKLAQRHRYIKMTPNLRQVEGINMKDVISMKRNNIEQVNLKLFGSSQSITVQPNQLRSDKGSIYAQLPNLITPKVLMRKRNLKRSKP